MPSVFVVIGCPIHNRAWLLPEYLEHIENLRIPIDVQAGFLFLLDNCDSETEHIIKECGVWLSKYRPQHRCVITSRGSTEHNYNRGTTQDLHKTWSHMAEVRNQWLDDALAHFSGYTHLFSVDSDIMVRESTLERLLKHKQPLVSALVDNSSGMGIFHNVMVEAGGVFRHVGGVELRNNAGLYACGLTGACVLIERRVINSGVNYSKGASGEDEGFCVAAKKKGFIPRCDTDHFVPHLMSKQMLSKYLEKHKAKMALI